MSSFKVTILGCGSAAPTLRRGASSQIVNIQEQFYLIDCGEGAQLQMRRVKARFQKVNQVFISHLHGDHYLGLIGFLSTLHLLGRIRDLDVFAPKGLQEIVEIQLKWSDTRLNYKVNFHEIDTTKAQIIFENNNVEVTTIPLKHRIPCTGFLFREKPKLRRIKKEKLKRLEVPTAYYNKIKQGFDFEFEDGKVIPNDELTNPPKKSRSYAYCSDTAYQLKMCEQINEVDLLYHESTFLHEMKDRAKATFHSTATQAAKIASQANVGRLVLGHYSARYQKVDEFKTEAKKYFSKVSLAEDGKVYEVKE